MRETPKFELAVLGHTERDGAELVVAAAAPYDSDPLSRHQSVPDCAQRLPISKHSAEV